MNCGCSVYFDSRYFIVLPENLLQICHEMLVTSLAFRTMVTETYLTKWITVSWLYLSFSKMTCSWQMDKWYFEHSSIFRYSAFIYYFTRDCRNGMNLMYICWFCSSFRSLSLKSREIKEYETSLDPRSISPLDRVRSKKLKIKKSKTADISETPRIQVRWFSLIFKYN